MRTGVATVLESTERESTRHAFYPTPDSLAERMLKKVDWHKVDTILEPSAGKGDLAYAVAEAIEVNRWGYRRKAKDERERKDYIEKAGIDCIEIDPLLRDTLKGAGFRVIHDDFLTFETQKRYNLIVMNPPFDRGAEHLAHAIDLQKHGGQVICLLNAETITNQCNEVRKRLMTVLELYGAEIEYIDGAFANAERKTGVRIALVRVVVPAEPIDDSILERMKKSPDYKIPQVPEAYAEIVHYNAIDEWVSRFNYEVACGLRLLDEWRNLSSCMSNSLSKDSFYSLIEVKVHTYGGTSREAQANCYIREVRRKYWSAIFQQPLFTDKLTKNLQSKLHDMVNELMDYDLSAYNILTIVIEMNKRMNQGIEDTIINLFDDWTGKYHWSETTSNRHYFDGWRTNDCFQVGKRVVIPLYGIFEDWYDKNKRFNYWKAVELFRDIQKVFDFLDAGNTYEGRPLEEIMKDAQDAQNYRIDTKYFKAVMYKKGTVHLEFKDMELLQKFNLFAARNKKWLPPTYGKRRYKDMTDEEKKVVDSFQGREAYEHVMDRADYFLPESPAIPMMMIGAGA